MSSRILEVTRWLHSIGVNDIGHTPSVGTSQPITMALIQRMAPRLRREQQARRIAATKINPCEEVRP